MKKIAFLVSKLGSGGAERVISVLATYFAKKEYDVTLFVFSEEAKYAIDERIKVVKLSGNASKLKKVTGRCKQAHGFMKENQITAIITFELYYALVLSRYKDIQVITSCRNYPKSEFKSPIGRMIQYWTFLRASHVVFQTEEQKKLFGRVRRCSIIPNPVNDEVFRIHRTATEKKIVTISRLEEQKNIRLLLDAMIDFHERYEDYILEIYGDGQLLQTYIRYTEEKKASNYIFFKGFCPNALSRIANASAFVLTSDFEGMPNALMEALSIGIYSVATDSYGGGTKSLIQNGYNGKLIPMNDRKALVDSLFLLETDSEAVKEMEENARKEREKYSSENIGVLWEKLIA